MVVDGEVLSEGVLLVSLLHCRHVLVGAAVARVPRLAPVLGYWATGTGTGHRDPAHEAVAPVHGAAAVVPQATLAVPSEAQGAVSLGAGLAG